MAVYPTNITNTVLTGTANTVTIHPTNDKAEYEDDVRAAAAMLRKNSRQKRYQKILQTLSTDLATAPKTVLCMHKGMPTAMYDMLLRASRKPINVVLENVRPIGSTRSKTQVSRDHLVLQRAGMIRRVMVDRKYKVYQPSRLYEDTAESNVNNILGQWPYNYMAINAINNQYSQWGTYTVGHTQPLPQPKPRPVKGTLQPYSGTSRKPKWEITLKGIELLEAAAASNRDFARFFAAYCPPSYLKKLKARLVKEKIIAERNAE